MAEFQAASASALASLIDKIEAAGIHLPPATFGIGSGLRY